MLHHLILILSEGIHFIIEEKSLHPIEIQHRFLTKGTNSLEK
jgi:hypothetical protein